MEEKNNRYLGNLNLKTNNNKKQPSKARPITAPNPALSTRTLKKSSNIIKTEKKSHCWNSFRLILFGILNFN